MLLKGVKKNICKEKSKLIVKFYNPKKSKAQKHDMVHVEVYLGDKDYKFATIGSRQIEAKVAYHDDYRFNSKYYKVYKISKKESLRNKINHPFIFNL